MDAPTAEDVKAQVREDFNWGRLGYDDDAELDKLVLVGNRMVTKITGRTFDLVATADEPLMLEACTLFALQLAYQRKPGYLSTVTDDMIASFSAGSYSETRRDPTKMRGGGKGVLPTINPWPALDTLLWLLMTEDQFDFWLETLTGQPRPAWAVTEVDWGNDTTGLVPDSSPSPWLGTAPDSFYP